ncbi:MAG: hypothetical protein LBK18_01750 [Prevotellaceae bacterium]|jgi:hypothetical protein|nr:hypothetical protein [Prevotellaceae bacterium]
MKIQKIFATAALPAMALAFSCSKEEAADKRDQFVEIYSAALNVTTTGNTVLASDTIAVSIAKSGEENFSAQVNFSIQSFAVSMELTTDSVFWHHAAGKSNVFKIPEASAKISGATAGTVKGIPLGATGYHGSFGYDSEGAQKLNLRVSGSLTPVPNMVIPITVTLSGAAQK